MQNICLSDLSASLFSNRWWQAPPKTITTICIYLIRENLWRFIYLIAKLYLYNKNFYGGKSHLQ